MTVFQAVVLGLVQGLAEFLPISSSAHLALTPYLLGWEDPGLAFDVALHLGTLVALVWYFRSDWLMLIQSAWSIVKTRRVQSMGEKRVIFIIVATIPGAIAGLLVNDLAEDTFRAPWLIATNLIVMGVLLWAVDKWAARARAEHEIRMKDAVMIGLAQMFALIPGVSRSGSTITAGRALGLERVAAARFSFLLSMPITSAAVLLKTPQAIAEQGFSAPLIAGVVAAGVSSWLAIAVLLRYLTRHSFGVFALYRLLLGAGVLILIFSGYRG